MEAPHVSPEHRPAKPQAKSTDESLKGDLRDALINLIREQVIHRLGSPPDLLVIQVRPVVKDRYRVNVVVGPHMTASKISHSYFVAVSHDGNIISSSPQITKSY